MPSFEQALGIHPQALTIRSRRAELLAANLANADTPNYRARDIDFKALLNGASSTVRMSATRSGHFGFDTTALAADETLYREPNQASLDQNTVDIAAERARFVDNAIRYQASLRFLDGRFSGIKTALRGE